MRMIFYAMDYHNNSLNKEAPYHVGRSQKLDVVVGELTKLQVNHYYAK